MNSVEPKPSSTRPLRVLVVEDSYHAATMVCSILESMGVEILGPSPTVKHAMQTLDRVSCDAAVLDINLGKESVQPVAERLRDAKIPFFFVSGYSSPNLISTEFRSRVHLHKPVEPDLIRREIDRLVAG